MAPPEKYLAGSEASSLEMVGSKSKKSRGLRGREKALIALAFCLIVATVTLAVLFAKEKNRSATPRTAETEEYCTSQDCIVAASRVIRAMDTSFEPCENFYDFACSSWIKENIIPDDVPRYSTFSELRDDVQADVKDILENSDTSKDIASTTKAKTLYAACINETAIEADKDSDLKALLTKEFGGWSLLDQTNWNPSSFNLVNMLKKLKIYHNDILFNFWAGADDKESTSNVVNIDQPSLGLPGRDYYLDADKQPQRDAYRKLAIDVAMKMQPSLNRTRLEQEVDAMIAFETEQAKILVPAEERRNATAMYNPMPMNELAIDYPNLNIQEILTGSFMNIAQLTLAPNERLINNAPAYFAKLNTLLPTVDTRVQANYAVWRFVKNRLTNLNKDYRALELEYRKVLHGTSVERPRWRTCAHFANDRLGMAVGRLYVQKVFSEESKQTANSMIRGLRKAFHDLLQENDWMDDETRARAAEKADKISEQIGYPEYILHNTSALDKEFERMTFAKDKHMMNVLETNKHNAWLTLEDLRRPVNKKKWGASPAVVNAYYSSAKNSITFPAAILQPPFYHSGQLKAMNYGGIGAVIGHEITHGFDDQGRQFDGEGNLRDWWSPQVVQRFQQRAKCIIEQYGVYQAPETGEYLNGNNTQGENIADNGGLVQSYKAYREWVMEQGHEEPKLPGLQYTPNQLFFINYAQIWCGAYRKSAVTNQIATGVHSLNRFRVIGTLSNTREFSKAFNCKAGSSMNPVKKCKVW